MAHIPRTPDPQTTSEFWRGYFAKFRRRVEDHEVSETGPAPLSERSEPSRSTRPPAPIAPPGQRRLR